ncbi:hypothetical protein V8G54_030475, partial [Vigna mungo]
NFLVTFRISNHSKIFIHLLVFINSNNNTNLFHSFIHSFSNFFSNPKTPLFSYIMLIPTNLLFEDGKESDFYVHFNGFESVCEMLLRNIIKENESLLNRENIGGDLLFTFIFLRRKFHAAVCIFYNAFSVHIYCA